MPHIVSTIHDPAALFEVCRRFGVCRPTDGCIQLDGREASGWIVRLGGLYAPVVFDTLTGLVAYHRRDNAFVPYARIMKLIMTCYRVSAAMRRSNIHQSCTRQRRLAEPKLIAS